MTWLAPELLYQDGAFRSGLALQIDEGRIHKIEPLVHQKARRLPRKALLPGLVNAHSHAFQRAIRGRTEFRNPDHPGDDFWSWRELMYEAAQRLTPEEVEVVSRMAFVEMVLSGITSVGEFHYLHHQPDGTPYENPEELSQRVLEAARWAGLTPVHLSVAYARSGFQRPQNPGQRRFLWPSPEDYLASIERLRSRGYRVGITPHSVRAVPRAWLALLRDYADQHSLPFHMHVSEQPREIKECLEEHGLRPIQMLAEEGVLGPRFVGVHAIHLADDEVEALAESFVCSCPTTERNLGDGVVPADRLFRSGARFCLGSDSNAQIDLLEDARQIDYHLRLEHLQRSVLDPLTEKQGLARRLFEAATRWGSEALGLKTGLLEVGYQADLMAVDLDDPSIAGATAEDLLATVVFGLERTAIREVWCAGRQLVCDGYHPRQRETAQAFARVMRRLAS